MVEQTIKVSLAGMRELELLVLPSPAGVFKMQQLTLTDKGIPVEYILSSYRGDSNKFHSILQADMSW